MRRERRRHRRDREHAGSDGDRDREHVVDEQRRGRDEARDDAEILLRDDVRAAARLVRLDRLGVREDDDREDRGDRDRDREDEVSGGDRCADEDDERGFRGVRDRGERIGGEDRQGELLREQRLAQLGGGARPADQRPLDDVDAVRACLLGCEHLFDASLAAGVPAAAAVRRS